LLRPRRLAGGALGGAAAGRTLSVRARVAGPRLVGVSPFLIAELLLHIVVSVAHPAPVGRIMLPVVADIVDVHRAIGDDASAAPVDATAPQVPGPRPAADRICGAERDAACEHSRCEITRRRKAI